MLLHWSIFFLPNPQFSALQDKAIRNEILELVKKITSQRAPSSQESTPPDATQIKRPHLQYSGTVFTGDLYRRCENYGKTIQDLDGEEEARRAGGEEKPTSPPPGCSAIPQR